MNKKEFIIVFVILVTFFGGISYLIYEDNTNIDTKVVMKNGKIYNCLRTKSSDGMTYIKTKNEWIEVPTMDIRIIKEINK